MSKEQQISFGMIQPSASMHENYIGKEAASTYELGDFDQAFFMYLDGQEHISTQEQRETLNIFPSEPMHVEPSTKFGMSLGAPTVKNASKKSVEQAMESSNTKNNSTVHPQNPAKSDKLPVKKDAGRKATTSSSDHEGPKTPDAKTLRRLAQNREAARKSRLRKKAYVQQLESCKMKLNQVEQEIQRARAQGMLLGGGILGEQGLPSSSDVLSSGAAVFDLEYARWLEEHHRLMMELRAALQERLQENEECGRRLPSVASSGWEDSALLSSLRLS